MTPEELKRCVESIADEPRRHAFLWVLAVVFLLFSVPFYYPTGREPWILWGLPDWCWITLLSNVAFAATVSVLVLRHWEESSDDHDSGRAGTDVHD